MSTHTTFRGSVAPSIALAILEALRLTDMPSETLDDEAFAQSLPRRLGLSDVIDTQIRRYIQMRERKEKMDAGELADLIRLIGRRPDAVEIFGAAGRELARARLARRGPASRLAMRVAPGGMRNRALLRAVRRLAVAVNPGASVDTGTSPLTLRVDGCLPAGACNTGAGCELLGAAFRTWIDRYCGDSAEVHHTSCEARGGAACAWTVENRAS